jgi:membrane-bound lytic murein transglycosylase MltF
LSLSVFFITATACKTKTEQASQANTAPPVATQASTPQTDAVANIDPSIVDRLKQEHWTGDLDGMLERRYIRALVLYNKTNFFYDGPQPRGITYEALKEFEKFLNAKLNTADKPVHLIFIPVTPEEALQRMRDGRGDMAASNVPIISQFHEIVDFSDPIRERAREIVVTGPAAPSVTSLEDLSGKEVFVRKLSRYWPNLQRLNERFRSEGRAPVILKEADQNLQDEDILDMVNAGLVGVTVMDDLVAGFWAKVYDGLSVHNDLSLKDDDKIGWAVRKETPKFLGLINEFVKDHKLGTQFGNVMLQKYLRDTKWAKNSIAPGEMEKFKSAISFFKKYAGQYKFEWLMIAAQAYQESTIDQTKQSSAGAVGVMQIKPSTAADKSVDVHGVDKDIEKNINAGVKYLNFIMENYFKDAQMNRINRGLFAFASYNAGPNRIAKLRKQAEAEGLNPNVWFNNVELIAAREIGAETVTYVSNIYKYYIAYQMASENAAKRRSSKVS